MWKQLLKNIAEEAEYMLVSPNFVPERANQTYFKISVILKLGRAQTFATHDGVVCGSGRNIIFITAVR